MYRGGVLKVSSPPFRDEQLLSLSLGKVGLRRLRRVGPEACWEEEWWCKGDGGHFSPSLPLLVPQGVGQPVRSRWLVPMGSQWGRG